MKRLKTLTRRAPSASSGQENNLRVDAREIHHLNFMGVYEASLSTQSLKYCDEFSTASNPGHQLHIYYSPSTWVPPLGGEDLQRARGRSTAWRSELLAQGVDL